MLAYIPELEIYQLPSHQVGLPVVLVQDSIVKLDDLVGSSDQVIQCLRRATQLRASHLDFWDRGGKGGRDTLAKGQRGQTIADEVVLYSRGSSNARLTYLLEAQDSCHLRRWVYDEMPSTSGSCVGFDRYLP